MIDRDSLITQDSRPLRRRRVVLLLLAAGAVSVLVWWWWPRTTPPKYQQQRRPDIAYLARGPVSFDGQTLATWPGNPGEPPAPGAAVPETWRAVPVSQRPDGMRTRMTPDARRIAVIDAAAADEYRVTVWDTATGRPVGSPRLLPGPAHPAPGTSVILDLAVSDDAAALVVEVLEYPARGPDGVAPLPASGRLRVWPGPEGAVPVDLALPELRSGFGVSHDGRWLYYRQGAAPKDEGRYRLRRIDGGVTVDLTERCDGEIAFLPGGDGLICQAGSDLLRVALTGAVLPAPQLAGAARRGVEGALVVSPDGLMVAQVDGDNTPWARRLTVRRLDDGRELLSRPISTEGPASVAFAPDGRRIAWFGAVTYQVINLPRTSPSPTRRRIP